MDIMENISNTSARSLARITGKIISLYIVFGDVTRLMTRNMHQVINDRRNWDGIEDLKDKSDLRNELKFWLSNIDRLNRRVMFVEDVPKILGFSDASEHACGGYLIRCNSEICHKMWSDSEKKRSSTWRKLKALFMSLQSFTKFIKNRKIGWFTDNQNVVRIVQTGSTKVHLQTLALNIFNFCVENDIILQIKWIPRTQNAKADFISKIIDTDDWEVTENFFNFMNKKWGSYTIDRFANYENTKVTRFNSKFWNPNTEAVDAFLQDWSNENNWLVPPVALVPKVINHLLGCKAKGTLVVPDWKSATFWPLLQDENSKWKWYIKDIIKFKNGCDICKQGKNKNSYIGSKNFKHQILAIRIDCSE
ncbi:uncharacterized protein LOC106173608 [Lingula anatina]|uniref:Uncharacterized protein LOC106173608 n=1 Tax=Lingula anatina TaxID=7574 RepID=A0A1S3JK01_LINAN|nr:uncharacterized protein LOC106173608 [Lingula anatina]|eukprot:XP_013410234.1 uncharacterized protein LOC106173608 [Lingula anatina]